MGEQLTSCNSDDSIFKRLIAEETDSIAVRCIEGVMRFIGRAAAFEARFQERKVVAEAERYTAQVIQLD